MHVRAALTVRALSSVGRAVDALTGGPATVNKRAFRFHAPSTNGVFGNCHPTAVAFHVVRRRQQTVISTTEPYGAATLTRTVAESTS
jgi:hypothetical protein